MSVFRKIVEEFFIDGIDKIQATSLSYDNGTVNMMRNALVMFSDKKITRDLGLSKDKRERLNKLKIDMQALSEPTDMEIKNALLALISTCKQDLLRLCSVKKHNTGSTERSVVNLELFVEAVHEKICVYLQLTDIPADIEIINILNYSAAKVCGRSVYEDKCIQLDPNLVLNTAKEKIIFDTLAFAKRIDEVRLETKATKPLGKEYFRQLMTERVKFILCEVQKIDQLANNAYVIKYMNEAIKSFNPSPIKVDAAQSPDTIIPPLPMIEEGQIPRVEEMEEETQLSLS